MTEISENNQPKSNKKRTAHIPYISNIRFLGTIPGKHAAISGGSSIREAFDKLRKKAGMLYNEFMANPQNSEQDKQFVWRLSSGTNDAMRSGAECNGVVNQTYTEE